MIDNTKFQMKNAIIISNKDDLKITLLMETIPTAQEFRDAIKSLSPNQQRFAKSVRAMQMQSTLFAFCIVQIKPQLEKVLNLPTGSLTKEIQVTQDLLKLFIDYQIPSDIMKFDGNESITIKEKIAAVKWNTMNVTGMINAAQEEEFEASTKQAQLRKEESEISEQDNYQYKKTALPPKKGRGGPGIKFKSRPKKSMAYREEAAPVSDMYLADDFVAAAPPCESAAPDQEFSPNEASNNESTQVSASPVIITNQLDMGPKLFKYTEFPSILEGEFESKNCGSVRPTIIKVGPDFTKLEQKGLLKAPNTRILNTEEQKSEKNKALDLLDAISRSGELILDESEIHVVVLSTQCFDDTLVNQVIQKDCNPIDLIERSTLVMAKALFGNDVKDMLNSEVLPRVKEVSPCLF